MQRTLVAPQGTGKKRGVVTQPRKGLSDKKKKGHQPKEKEEVSQ